MERVVARSISNIEMGISEKYESPEPQIFPFAEEHLIAISVDGIDPEEDLAFVSLIHKYASICQNYNLETDYHTGAILSQEAFMSGNFTFQKIYTKIDKPSKNPYYMKKIAGDYLTILVRGWEIQSYYEKIISYIKEHHLKPAGDVFAYDVSGYLLNSREENTMTLISFRVER